MVPPIDRPDLADLDRLADRLAREHQLRIDGSEEAEPEAWRAEAIRTLAEHHDRRVIPPLIAALSGTTVSTIEVRAAGLIADPGLHPVLDQLAAKRHPDDDDDEFWDAVGAARARCRPDAAAEAEEVEATMLAAIQASLVEAGMEPVDIALVGEYPETEMTFAIADRAESTSIWNFDEADPASPTTLDRAFTMYRLANLARWL